MRLRIVHTNTTALVAILFAAFVVALGYGAILPVLPLMIERLLGSSEPAVIARHTALLTGAFAIAPLAAAFPWGRLSDRYGRRPILVVSLVGFAVTLTASVLSLGLPFLYVARLLNGGFASAVLPSALAFVADTESDEIQRARTFGWVSVASSLGLLAGPMLGGFVSAWGATVLGDADAASAGAFPFMVVAALAVAAAILVRWLVLGGPAPERRNTKPQSPASVQPGEIRLLVLAASAAGGLGAFEVGLTLQSRALAMSPATLGLMFATCMVVMLIVQGIAFSPLVKPLTTRWFIAPSFAVMAVGLVLIPLANGSDRILVATGLVAASGGLLAPMIAYWVSRISGRGQGAELGLQTAVVSLGQTVGSVGAGLLFASNSVPGIAFFLPAAAMAIAAAVGLRLPAQLAVREPRLRTTEAELARR
jgi:MFS family permease